MPKYSEATHERAIAESKIGIGIAKIYDHYKKKSADLVYDVQGIATVELSENEVKEYSDYFPNQLCNGIQLHFYKEDHIKYPPLRHMINQKVQSLCDAAKIEFNINSTISNHIKNEIEEIVKKEFAEFKKRIDVERSKLEKSEPNTEIRKQKIEKYQARELHKLAKGSKKPKFKGLMTICMGITAKRLYESYKRNPHNKPFASSSEFNKKLRHASEIRRSHARDILTIDERTKNFSYDGLAYFPKGKPKPEKKRDVGDSKRDIYLEKKLDPMKPVTAHNKTVGQRIANLSLVCEGRILSKGAAVTSSIVKHASIAPDNDLDWKENKLENLMYACNATEDIMLAQAQLRLHGRDETTRSSPVQIDWNYQLLTSNFWNDSRQATNYGYAVRALKNMSGSTLYTHQGTEVQTTMHVFNAGINMLGKVNFLWKVDTQRIENRKAYVHMTHVLAHHENFDFISTRLSELKTDFFSQILHRKNPPADITNKQQAIKDEIKLLNKISHLKNFVTPNTQQEEAYRQEYDAIQVRLAQNAKTFNLLRQEYNEHYENYKNIIAGREKLIKQTSKMSLYELNRTRTGISPILSHPDQKKALLVLYKKELDEAKRNKNNLETRITACETLTKRLHKELRHNTYQLEKIRQEEWKSNQTYVKNLIEELKDPEMQAILQTQSPEVILSLAALIYKSYMDDLYYSGKYRERELAPIMNAYMASYQHTLGMMASSGCKSANDRAFIFRLFFAAINGLPFDPNQPDRLQTRPMIPEPYHSDPAQREKLIQTIGEQVTSNSGMMSCITDTSGTPPKVDSKWHHFPYFRPIAWFFDFISKFGKFAPHKLKTKTMEEAIKAGDKYLAEHAPTSTKKKSSSSKKYFHSIFDAKEESKYPDRSSDPSSPPKNRTNR